MAIIKHMTNHASYDEIMERLDNALIKNESLQDEIKILKHNELVRKDQADKIIRLNGVCDSRMIEIDALIEDKKTLVKEIKALKLDKKELEKDVEFYRSKIKVLLNDMLEYTINLGNKGGK